MKEGWELKKLGEVCEIKGRIGYRGYTKNDLVEKGQGAITLSPSNIQNNKFNTNECTYISWFKYDESPEIKVFEGDILFVKTGSTYGKVALVENLSEKATINPQFVVLKEIKCINKFLYYAMTTKSFKEQVENIIGGAATPTLSQTNLAQLYIFLPTPSEQQRIVEILDTAFAKIGTVKQNAERNLQNAKELFLSVLDQSFISSETYGVKKIIDILEKTETTNPLNKPNFFFKYIDVSSVSNKTFRIEETSTIMGKDAPSRARKLIKKGDVIFATVRPTLKRISVIPEEFDNEICSTGYCVLRPSEKTLTNWIFYFLQTTSFLSIMERLQRGASYPAVTDGDIKNQIIPVPPISDQQQIVSKLDALSAKCKELENNYLQTINDCDELKKAILAKAFNGEL